MEKNIVESNKMYGLETFFVVNGYTGCLVIWKTWAQKLGLVQIAASIEGNIKSNNQLVEKIGKVTK